MTALNFVLEESQVLVVTDSLALSAETGRPLLCTTKVFPLPHLRGVVVGTGMGHFAIDWFRYVNTQMIVRNIPHLDDFAPEGLRALWAAVPADLRARSTSTIYHFGFDERQSRFRGFAYRSEQEFRSEELPYGIGIKPQADPGDLQEFPRDFVQLIERQRKEDQARALSERVGIGGDVFAFHLTPEGLTLRGCHRFEDYEDAFIEMCENAQR